MSPIISETVQDRSHVTTSITHHIIDTQYGVFITEIYVNTLLQTRKHETATINHIKYC